MEDHKTSLSELISIMSRQTAQIQKIVTAQETISISISELLSKVDAIMRMADRGKKKASTKPAKSSDSDSDSDSKSKKDSKKKKDKKDKKEKKEKKEKKKEKKEVYETMPSWLKGMYSFDPDVFQTVIPPHYTKDPIPKEELVKYATARSQNAYKIDLIFQKIKETNDRDTLSALNKMYDEYKEKMGIKPDESD